VKIVFFGTPEFAVLSLEAVIAAGHEVQLVVSRPDKPAGRHLRMTTPAVIHAARRLGLPLAQPHKVRADDLAQRLRALAPDAAIVVAFGRILPAQLLSIPAWGFVNVHPSLLPRHRGPSPIEWAIACGDERTGVTTMLLDEGMDTGPILMQRGTAILPKEHAPDLERRLAAMGAELLVETLAGLESGDLEATPQDEVPATVSPKLERKMGRIDWSAPADVWARRCRAFDPWPGLYCSFRGSRLKIHGLEVGAPRPGNDDPGTVVEASVEGITVRCGEGTVAVITELQREGKRRLPADAFIIGERVARGERFH
jgi:methionyl-tRNA formyltransferase